ncbi:hypothetical protein JCM11491_005927 [Sporobolomyces phaffii]
MTPRGGPYIPLQQYPTPSLAHSRLFTAVYPPHQPSIWSRVTRPTLRSLAIVIASGVVIIVLAWPRQQLTWLQLALLAEDIDFRLGFTQLYSAAGWRELDPPERNETRLSPPLLEASWSDRCSDECVESWVAEGEVCRDWPRGDARQVDAVWTYSNGSDPLLSVWRAEVTAMLTGSVSRGISTVRAAKRARHFREHDELRYSIRSVLDSFAPGSLSKLHILTTDLPANTLLRDTIERDGTALSTNVNESRLVDASRIGQIPHWLSRDASSSVPPLSVIHHSNFFQSTSHLPTFNSLSIESQFPFLSQVNGPFFLYLNDDTFLLGRDSLVETDVGSSLLGTVFRLQDDLTVGSSSPDERVLSPEGEWASLERANWLLDRRFGVRERNYLAHIPKAMSMPILREIGILWRDELEVTASSRFRGLNVEYQLPFLATHYTIESHRQALLLAFIVERTDRDSDGILSPDERRQMLTELGFERDEKGEFGSESTVVAPYRSTRNRLTDTLARVGLRYPRSTLIGCTSMDGHCTSRAHERRRNPPVRYEQDSTAGDSYCRIDLRECFGDGFLDDSATVSTLDVFKRVSFERTECGDCMIVHLVAASGDAGLSSFLPGNSSTLSTRAPSNHERRPFNLESSAKTFRALGLPRPPRPGSSESRRVAAAREILRYSYVLGDSKSKFHGMRTPRDTERVVKDVTDADIDENRNLTFLTLNDDFSNDHVSEMSQPILDDFFAKTWPLRSPYEI